MMPAPITMTSAFRPTPISVFPDKGIAFVEQQLVIGAHIGLPANKGGNAIHSGDSRPETRCRSRWPAALVRPAAACLRCQTRQFGTGAGAARGAMQSLPGWHEAAAVGLDRHRKFDSCRVIAPPSSPQMPACSNVCRTARVNAVNASRFLFIDGQRRLADQEEPVAARGDVTVTGP